MYPDFNAMAQLFLKKTCVFLFLLCSLSGCLTIHNLNVTSGNGSPPQSTPVAVNGMEGGGDTRTPVPISEMTALESPPALSFGATTPSYSLQPGDHLDVKFFYNKELNDTVIVRPDGRISLQLVHDVRVASLSPDELVTVLKKRYSTHLKDPEISVIVREIENHKIFVDGQVSAPGGVQIFGNNMAIMQAIASVGGLKDTALREEVLLIRRNGLKKPFVYIVNLDAAMDGSDISQNVMLRANDIVYVPKSTIANVNTWVDMYIRRNIPINVNMETIRIQ